MELTEDNLDASSSDKNNEEDSLKFKEDATDPCEKPKSNPDIYGRLQKKVNVL